MHWSVTKLNQHTKNKTASVHNALSDTCVNGGLDEARNMGFVSNSTHVRNGCECDNNILKKNSLVANSRAVDALTI